MNVIHLNKKITIVLILGLLVLSLSFVSAGWFSDVWDEISGNTITGNAISGASNFDGWFDGVSDGKFIGWACDKNNPNDELIIHFYFDSLAYANGAKLATIANLEGELAIGNRCGGDSGHRFSIEIPPE